MTIYDAINQTGLSFEELCKRTGIPASTLSDILGGKADLSRCQARTVQKLALGMGVSMDELMEFDSLVRKAEVVKNKGKDLKSQLRTVTHSCENTKPGKVHPYDPVLDITFPITRTCLICDTLLMSEVNLINKIVESHEIEEYYSSEYYLESLYLLGMLDYLCEKNGKPLIPEFEVYRNDRMDILIDAFDGEPALSYSRSEIKQAIPQLYRFNIYETPDTLLLP